MSDILGYKGKDVVITGAASGMGASATELLLEAGANVYALDIGEVSLPVSKAIKVNIMEKDSIDAALEELPAEIFALFNCAGVPHPPTPVYPTLMINFVGLRYLTEALIPRISQGGGIASIASTAGMGWKANLDKLNEFFENDNFEATSDWVKDNEDYLAKADAYGFSKQCIIVYTMKKAGELAKNRVRINCIAPAPTQSAFMDNLNSSGIGDDVVSLFKPAHGEYAKPEDMGHALVALNSKLNGFVSGNNLPVDFGYCAEIYMGQRDNLLGV